MCKDISFIVTVYNKKTKEIIRCLNSISSVKNIFYEILLIDDGSKDELSNLYKKITSHYDNVKYIRKENGGAASARNYGLSIASGKYVYFVDADDSVVATAFSKNDFQKNEELVIYDVNIKSGNGTIEKFSLEGINSGKVKAEEILTCALKNGLLNWAVGKLYLRKFLIDKGLKFDEEKISGEDIDFVIKVLFLSPIIKYKKTVSYIYFFDTSTNIHRINKNPINSLDDALSVYRLRKKIANICKKHNTSELDIDFVNSVFEIYGLSLINKKDNIDKIYENLIKVINISHVYKCNNFLANKKLNWIKNNKKRVIKTFFYIKKRYSSLRRETEYK